MLEERPLVDLFPEVIARVLLVLDTSNTVRSASMATIRAELESTCAFYSNNVVARDSKPKRIDELRPIGKVRGYTYLEIKGSEFHAVAVLDVNGTAMPYYRSNDEWDDLRSLYVGVTRSKSHLLIHTPSGNNSNF